MMKRIVSASRDPVPSHGAAARAREDGTGSSSGGDPAQECLQRILGDREVAAFRDAQRALRELCRQWPRRAQRGCAQDRERLEAGARLTDGKIHSRTLASTYDRKTHRCAPRTRSMTSRCPVDRTHASGWPDTLSGWPDTAIALSHTCEWQGPCFVPSAMNNLQTAASTHFDLFELLRDRAATRGGWSQVDASHVEIRDLGRLARLVEANARCAATATERSFAVIGVRGATYNDVSLPPGLRTGGRHYSLALLALIDALAAEPSCSPLSAPLPLDDLRAAAFFVAAESTSGCPDLVLVERSMQWVDRCLAHLRMPLRATGYLAARDALRAVLDGGGR
jgi:hypothetical protein